MPTDLSKMIAGELLYHLSHPIHIFTFVDQKTGEEEPIEAPDVEYANLKAWSINPNLKWKGWITGEDNG